MADAAPPEKNHVHPDIAKALGLKLLEPLEITRGFMEQAVREARQDMKRMNLATKLREATHACLADCGPITRQLVKAILDEFEKLDEEKP